MAKSCSSIMVETSFCSSDSWLVNLSIISALKKKNKAKIENTLIVKCQ